MMFNFEISRLALQDLDDIWEYTAEHWSKQQANKYYKEVFEAIKEICMNSEIGKPIDDIKYGHRSLNFKSHRIIHKIKKVIIYIDRILHQKMDIDKHLNE